MLKSKHFINSSRDPTTNVDYDAEKKKRYENNLDVLKRVIQAVNCKARFTIGKTQEQLHRRIFQGRWKQR